MKVYVRKIARYQPEHNGLDRYDGYDEITTKRFDPPIIEISERMSLPDGVGSILSSDALRARQTTEHYKGAEKFPSTYSPLWAEVAFSLKKLISKDEYVEHGSDLVRERFIQAFISDTLDESRDDLQKRLESCLGLLKNHQSTNVLVVSHSFFMKILEIYILTNSRLFDNPELLAEHVDPMKKLYDFNTGFDLQIVGGTISLE